MLPIELLQIQLLHQFLNGEFVVGGHRFQYTAQQGASFQRSMAWNRNVVCSVDAGGKPDV